MWVVHQFLLTSLATDKYPLMLSIAFSLGNDDVKKETAKVTSALPVHEFLDLLQNVRRVLAKSMPTVCYKSLIRMGRLTDGDKLEGLMQAAEDVMMIRARANASPASPLPSQDTPILTVFHWVCFHFQVCSLSPRNCYVAYALYSRSVPRPITPNYTSRTSVLEIEVTDTLTEGLSPKRVPLIQKAFKERGTQVGV